MRILDAFCCEGGAARGYHDTGFEVVGVDIEGRFAKRYPYEFHQGDAIQFIREHGHEFDAIHASPPCQGYSVATVGVPDARAKHPRLIREVRNAILDLNARTGLPYVIENVVGARHSMIAPVLLCGSMFGLGAIDKDGTVLRLERHRLFETNWLLMAPGICRHDKSVPVGGVYGGGRSNRWEAKHVRRGGYTPDADVRRALIGADWMTMHGANQAIPPAYTEWIGTQLRDYLTAEAAS